MEVITTGQTKALRALRSKMVSSIGFGLSRYLERHKVKSQGESRQTIL